MGAVVPEALAAAERLDGLGCPADVVVVTGPGLLFRAVQGRRGLDEAPPSVLDAVLPAERAAPMVTVLDGHPHTLAFLAGVRGVPATHLGVTHFGQSGDLERVYRHHGLDTGTVIGAALDLIDQLRPQHAGADADFAGLQVDDRPPADTCGPGPRP